MGIGMLLSDPILAIDTSDVLQVIVLVVVMLLAALGNFLKKKPSQQDKGKVMIIPPPERDQQGKMVVPPRARARPQVPPEAAPRRPTATPQARPTLVQRQPLAQVRPPPVQQPVPPQRPQPTSARPRRARRVQVVEHAEQVVAQDEHVASRLKEIQMRKAGKLGLDQHAHGEQPPPRRPMRLLLSRLNPKDMKQAIVLSEIIQPPLALREDVGLP